MRLKVDVELGTLEQETKDEAENASKLQETSFIVEYAQSECRHSQRLLDENKDLLVLYCQQFARAPEMIGACA